MSSSEALPSTLPINRLAMVRSFTP
jgi:hypothetical protein